MHFVIMVIFLCFIYFYFIFNLNRLNEFKKISIKQLIASYSDYMGAIECTPCGTGMYSSKRGSNSSIDCLQCPQGKLISLFLYFFIYLFIYLLCEGYFCPDSSTSSPTPCPSNAYCPIGYFKSQKKIIINK